MAFNTGNPVPSNKAEDLSDNAENLDSAVNSTGATWTDRLGVVRQTVIGATNSIDAASTQGLIDIAQDVSDVEASADAFDTLALDRVNKIGVIYDSPIRDWSASLLVDDLRAHRYPATTGDIYIPKKALPFTTGATFEHADWNLLQGITDGDIINDLSQAYKFKTVALMKSSNIVFPVGKKLSWQGYYAESDGGSNWGVVASGAHTDDGGSIFTLADGKYVEANLKGRGRLSVLKFGAKGDNTGDDIEKLQAATTYINTNSGANSTFQFRTLWMPSGTYPISSPWLLPHNYRIDGDGATIKALAGFTPSTRNNAGGGGTIDLDPLLLFLLGDYNDISAPQRPRASVSKEITLDCNEVTSSGLYMERMPYSDVNCKVMNTIAGGNAIDINVYCWGVHLNGVIVENFSENAIAIGQGSNGVTVTSPRIWGETKAGVSGILIKSSANVNGVSINGGFIEKLAFGVNIGRGNGSVSVTGVDFEVCSNNCIAVNGDSADTFRSTVKAIGCYFSSTGSNIYAKSAMVAVESCRLRAGVNFETANPAGFIEAKTNQYETGTPNIVANSNVAVDIEQDWTPELWDDSLSGAEGQTYSIQKGTFSRVSNKVFFKAFIQMSSLGTLTVTNGLRIGGLPFSASGIANSHSSVTIGAASGLSLLTASSLSGYVGVSAEHVTIQKLASTSGYENVSVDEFSASGLIILSGFYSI